MAPSRNSPCPCGSGRKYKHCCLARDRSRKDGLPSLPAPGSPERSVLFRRAAAALGVALVAGTAVGVWRRPVDGLAIGAGVLLLAFTWFQLRAPTRR